MYYHFSGILSLSSLREKVLNYEQLRFTSSKIQCTCVTWNLEIFLPKNRCTCQLRPRGVGEIIRLRVKLAQVSVPALQVWMRQMDGIILKYNLPICGDMEGRIVVISNASVFYDRVSDRRRWQSLAILNTNLSLLFSSVIWRLPTSLPRRWR